MCISRKKYLPERPNPFCHSDEGGIGPALARKPGVSRAANAGFLLRRNDKAKQYLSKSPNPPNSILGDFCCRVQASSLEPYSTMRRTTHNGEFNFITLTVVDWVDVFTRAEYKDFIIQCLKHCQKNKGLDIYAYVIMTNHLHLVVQDTTIPLSDILRDFKSYTSKEMYRRIEQNPQESRKHWLLETLKKHGEKNPLNLKHQFWQNQSHPTVLIGHAMAVQKIRYVHENPVRAGFVNEPHEYLYSSAHPTSLLKVLEM